MQRFRRTPSFLVAPLVLLPALGCTEPPAADGTDTDGSSGTTSVTGSTSGTTNADTSTTDPTTTGDESPTTTDPTATGPETTGCTTECSDSSSGDGTTEGESTGTTTGDPPCEVGDPGCAQGVDLLFVIDNSGTMGEEQQSLASSFPLFVEQLRTFTDAAGTPVDLDVHVMVTTTDMGNPLCTPFEPAGYDPAMGEPIDTACIDRLQGFTDLTGTNSIPEACTTLCPVAVTPADPYVAFDAMGSNVPGAPVDIDGDGTLDSPAAQALACIGPQGINGCGYESPLETMLQALNPSAAWNSGADPFLREGATLGVVIVTDEADCSLLDASLMEDPAFQNINPNTGVPSPSSAICWNAGMTCDGPDGMGVYSNCMPTAGNGLQPVSRYTSYLIDELRVSQGKEVFMLGIVGVPSVTAHAVDSPFEPTGGGVLDLVYRDWRDGAYPVGDILPDEFAMGQTAATKQHVFGIGPACTGADAGGSFTGQAIPPGRIRETCEALDLGAAGEDLRCGLESVCDDDYTGAITTLVGMLQQTLP